MRLEHLPADAVGLTPLARRVLADRPEPRGLPGLVVPADLESFPFPPEDAREDELFRDDERDELANDLERGLVELEPPVAVLDGVRALRLPGTRLLLTGQQPGLFGGPLFDTWKALHAIRLARELAARTGVPVVPAFWNHGDDHDLAEVHHAWIRNRNLDVAKVGLAGMSSTRQPLSRVVVDRERQRLGAVAETLRRNLWEGPHTEAALELCLPRDGESLARAFTRTLTSAFGHLGLVVIEPDWIRARLSRALAQVVGSDPNPALAAGADALRALGFEPAIDPASAALVYRVDDGGRQPLRAGGDGFRYDDEPGSRTPAELAAEIIQEPAAFHAGGLLRPLVQDLALPVAAWIGGQGELGYHAALGPLRVHADVPRTPFVPRSSVTVVEPEARASLDKLGLSVREALDARGELTAAEGSAPEAGAAVAGRLRAVARRAADGLGELRPELAELDRGLGVQLRRTAAELEALVERIATRADRVHANRAGKGRRHLRRVDASLFPRGAPQERVTPLVQLAARFGLGWAERLVDELDPLPTEHVVLHLEEDEA